MKLNSILTKEKGYNKAVETFPRGVMAFYRALMTVKEEKGLKKFFVIPFLLNLVLLSSIFYYTYTFVYPAIIEILPPGDMWYLEALRWLISPFILVILAIIIVFIYSITGVIITSPFNDSLSLKVETMMSDISYNEKFSFSDLFSDIVITLSNTIKLLLLLVISNLVIFLMNFIPIVGSVFYSALSFMSLLFFLGSQFFDFPLGRRKLLFADKLKVMWDYKFMVMGVGLGFFIVSLIPIIGFLGLNLGTVGATLLFLENIQPRMKI